MGTAAGGTVLHWAAASGNKDMLAFLLERALDPNTQSYAGQTPLHVAAGRGHDACVRLLLSDNAQPDLGAPSALQTSFPLVLQNCVSLRRW
jgi:ankyrin repeat protein